MSLISLLAHCRSPHASTTTVEPTRRRPSPARQQRHFRWVLEYCTVLLYCTVLYSHIVLPLQCVHARVLALRAHHWLKASLPKLHVAPSRALNSAGLYSTSQRANDPKSGKIELQWTHIDACDAVEVKIRAEHISAPCSWVVSNTTGKVCLWK